MTWPMPHGLTVARLRRVDGGSWETPDRTTINGLIVQPASSGSADWVVLGPVDVDLSPGDRLVWPGSRCEVTGQPVRLTHPMTGWMAGSQTPVAFDPLPLLTDRCEVRAEAAWTDAGRVPGAVVAQWHGADSVPCLIVDASADGADSVGEQDVAVRRLTVTLPCDVPGGLVGRVLHVTGSGVPLLVGADLKVVSEAVAARPLARVVTAALNLTP